MISTYIHTNIIMIMMMRVARATARLRRLLVGVVLLPGIGIGAARSGGDPGSDPDPGLPAPPVKTMACGPNTLFMLLQLQGRPVTYQQVVRELGSDDKMTSMLELREAAARLGLSTRIRRCPLQNLDSCTVPSIAHTQGDYRQRPDIPSGHYWLVLKVDEVFIHYIDGTYGEVMRVPRSKLSKSWNGYVLEPRPEGWTWSRTMMALNGLGLLAVLGVVLQALHRRSSVGARRLRAGLLVIACGWATGVAPVAASEPYDGARGPLAEWRSPPNEAANCLYLRFATLGSPVEYARVREAVLAEGAPASLATLRAAARRCGLPMRIVRCGPDELTRMPKPVIVYMLGVRTGGRFALLLNLGDEKSSVIWGTTACIEEMTSDAFRRHFSRFALVPETADDGWVYPVTGSLVLVAGYLGWRLRIGA